MPRRSRVIVLTLVPLLALSFGCKTPSDREVLAFLTATERFAEAGEQALNATNEAVILRRMHERSLEGGVIDFEGDLFVQFLEDEDLGPRLEFFDALKRQAAALRSLASADGSTKIDTAALEFAGTFNALRTNYTVLTGRPTPSAGLDGVFAASIAAAGRLRFEQQRQEAIRAAITAQKDLFDQIMPILQREFSTDGAIPTAHIMAARALYVELASDYNANEAGWTSGQRLSRLADIRARREAWQEIRRMHAGIEEALAALIDAQASLHDAVVDRKRTFDDIYAQIARLVDAAKELKDVSERVASGTN